MNEVYDNDMRFIPFLKFLDKYKSRLISLLVIVIAVTAYFLISAQISKQNHENAAEIYSEWLIEISNEEPDLNKLETMLENLTKDFSKTGYAQVALLTKANLDAKENRLNEALVNFDKLINLTDGFRGNDVFNKMARVSAARIELAMGNFEDALTMIERYSSSETNAYIHELTGDILAKQGKFDLARNQYSTASGKYSDQPSISIVSMKIANLGT